MSATCTWNRTSLNPWKGQLIHWHPRGVNNPLFGLKLLPQLLFKIKKSKKSKNESNSRDQNHTFVLGRFSHRPPGRRVKDENLVNVPKYLKKLSTWKWMNYVYEISVPTQHSHAWPSMSTPDTIVCLFAKQRMQCILQKFQSL